MLIRSRSQRFGFELRVLERSFDVTGDSQLLLSLNL